jgi:hypothetical protein
MAWIEQADGWWLTGTALSVRVDPSGSLGAAGL